MIYSSLLSWRDSYLRKLNDLSKNSQNRRSGEKDNSLFETYKNSVMPHGRYIYAAADGIDMATMCAYTQSQHELPHWKCVLRCCSNFPCTDLPYHE